MSRSSKKIFRRISKNKYENKSHQSSNSHMNPKIWLKYFKKTYVLKNAHLHMIGNFYCKTFNRKKYS